MPYRPTSAVPPRHLNRSISPSDLSQGQKPVSTLDKHSSKHLTTAESIMEAEVVGGVIRKLDNAMSLEEKFKLGMTLKKRASSSLAITRNKASALGTKTVRVSAKNITPGTLASSNMDVTTTGFTGVVKPALLSTQK